MTINKVQDYNALKGKIYAFIGEALTLQEFSLSFAKVSKKGLGLIMKKTALFKERASPMYKTKQFGLKKAEKPGKNEFKLDQNRLFILPKKPSDQIKKAVKDLKDFLSIEAGLKLSRKKQISKLYSKSKKSLKTPESYNILCSSGKITIEAADSSGIMYAIFYLEDMMKLRKAAIFSESKINRKPVLKARILHSPMMFFL